MDMHDFIKATLTNRGVSYSILSDNVLRFVHLPRVIHTVGQLYGNVGEMMLSELAFHGRASYEKCASSLLRAVSEDDVSSIGKFQIQYRISSVNKHSFNLLKAK
jgi:ABC-type antimicrobial peptide transport system permease subunit